MTDEQSVSGEDVARRLAKVWGGGVERVLSQGLPPADVARSLVAVGLELWTKTEGTATVAGHLNQIATELRKLGNLENPSNAALN
jgi:hypothetical protein